MILFVKTCEICCPSLFNEYIIFFGGRTEKFLPRPPNNTSMLTNTYWVLKIPCVWSAIYALQSSQWSYDIGLLLWSILFYGCGRRGKDSVACPGLLVYSWNLNPCTLALASVLLSTASKATQRESQTLNLSTLSEKWLNIRGFNRIIPGSMSHNINSSASNNWIHHVNYLIECI